jgi:hypothetical protein
MRGGYRAQGIRTYRLYQDGKMLLDIEAESLQEARAKAINEAKERGLLDSYGDKKLKVKIQPTQELNLKQERMLIDFFNNLYLQTLEREEPLTSSIGIRMKDMFLDFGLTDKRDPNSLSSKQLEEMWGRFEELLLREIH